MIAFFLFFNIHFTIIMLPNTKPKHFINTPRFMNEWPLTARLQPIVFQTKQRYICVFVRERARDEETFNKTKSNHSQFGRGVTQSDLNLYANDEFIRENFYRRFFSYFFRMYGSHGNQMPSHIHSMKNWMWQRNKISKKREKKLWH